MLDNAAELLMFDAVAAALETDSIYARLHRSIDETPAPPEEKERMRFSLGHTPMSVAQRAKLNKYFDEKALFLAKQEGLLPVPLASVLSRLHGYRNEAYHRAELRPGSLRPATLVLFTLVCELLERLRPHRQSFHSDDDLQWMKPYGFSFFDPDARSKVASSFRKALAVDEASVKLQLATHLELRLKELSDRIGFISQMTAEPEATALKAVQYWNSDRSRNPYFRGESFEAFKPQIDLASIERWRHSIKKITASTDSLSAFSAFATLETEIEALEALVNEVADLIDAASELASDIARGK